MCIRDSVREERAFEAVSGRAATMNIRMNRVVVFVDTYDLVWKRTLASQMVDARLTQDKVRLESTLRGVAGFDADVHVVLSLSLIHI